MKKRIKILLVAGARPNFMKIAPIYHELKKHKQFYLLIIHTGQHYDKDMSDIFFRDLKLPKPDIYLGVGSASHAIQTARIMEKFDPVCLKEKPDLVIVVGDVNSTIACAMTAVKLGIKVAHVEAGLRSFDRSMPEEINRLLTDQISDYLFTTCKDADKNLMREGIAKQKIFFVGNVMIDSSEKVIARIKRNKNAKIKQPYVLVTLHRPSNVDDKKTLLGIMSALRQISKIIPVIFPVHPRTLKMLKVEGLEHAINDPRILFSKPLGYLIFTSLMSNAALVLTDSGGIQEETTILGVPCLTLRHNTERPITITQGTNKLVGTDPKKIVKEASKSLTLPSPLKRERNKVKVNPKRPQYWDGKAAQRIVRILINEFS